MSRRISAFLIGVLLLCTAALPCAAAQPASSVQQSVIHTEYGDIVVTKRANKKHSFTYQGENIATVTLFATFGYDGKSAWVEEASASHDTSGGWSYGREVIDTDGSTAALSARLTKSSFTPVDFKGPDIFVPGRPRRLYFWKNRPKSAFLLWPFFAKRCIIAAKGRAPGAFGKDVLLHYDWLQGLLEHALPAL